MKHYALIYTTRKNVMESFGRKFGYSLGHLKTTKIDTPLKIDTSLPGIWSFLTDEDDGFQIQPITVEAKQNAIVFVTNNNIYVFEEI